MSEEEKKEIEDFNNLLDEILPDREAAIEFFKESGLMDKNGNFKDLMRYSTHVPYGPVHVQ